MNTHITELLEKFKQLSKEKQKELIENIEANFKSQDTNNQKQNTEMIGVEYND